MQAELMYDGLKSDELPLDCLESPFYEDPRASFNVNLGYLLEQLLSGKFQDGVIPLKITLSATPDSEAVPEKNLDSGGEQQGNFSFKRPDMKYEVKTNLKKTSKDTGESNERRVFVCRDKRFIAVPVPTAQITFDELSRRRNELL